MANTACQFCSEIQGTYRTRFHDIYGPVLRTRIVADSQHFVAFPTIGQLFPGSILVVPKEHVETFAQLTSELQTEALHLIQELEPRLERYGHLFLFEHGAQSSCGGGCGIYHAHIHLIPCPRPTKQYEIVDFRVQHASTLLEAWSRVEDSVEYLALRDGFGAVGYCAPGESGMGFGSQYCRRRIVEHFDLERPWDWRAYDSVEPFLLETVEALRAR
jgi:diadenosine tetraphosphate (Ap4A) HIT family hydrolase